MVTSPIHATDVDYEAKHELKRIGYDHWIKRVIKVSTPQQIMCIFQNLHFVKNPRRVL